MKCDDKNEAKGRKSVTTHFMLFFTPSIYQPIRFYDVKKNVLYNVYQIAVIYTIVSGFGPRLDFKPAVKEKIDAAAEVFLKYTSSQFWLRRGCEIVVTFFGLRMRPQSSHTKFLVPSPRPNSPTRIVSRLPSRMPISMADGKPGEIANCIVTSCGFSSLTISAGSRAQQKSSQGSTKTSAE